MPIDSQELNNKTITQLINEEKRVGVSFFFSPNAASKEPDVSENKELVSEDKEPVENQPG